MPDPLELLWPLLDAPDPVVAAHVVSTWPSGALEALVGLGFLQPSENADRVLCPECHSHEEEVIAVEGPNGRTRFVIECPEVLRAEVSPKALSQWAVDCGCLIGTLARGLAVKGKCVEQVPNRLWRLGRTKWQDVSRDVLFARGLHWDDGQTVRSTIVRAHKPIVFVPLRRPPSEFWRRPIPVLVLSHVASFGDNGIEVEPLEILAAIQDADAQAASALGPGLTTDGLKQMIRRQVKAEGKLNLQDDAYVEAYRQLGSVREAAKFLTQETGQDVSKDQVQRALNRNGGAAAVLNNADSDSVVRTVASQRRDRSGKILHRPKPKEDN